MIDNISAFSWSSKTAISLDICVKAATTLSLACTALSPDSICNSSIAVIASSLSPTNFSPASLVAPVVSVLRKLIAFLYDPPRILSCTFFIPNPIAPKPATAARTIGPAGPNAKNEAPSNPNAPETNVNSLAVCANFLPAAVMFPSASKKESVIFSTLFIMSVILPTIGELDCAIALPMFAHILLIPLDNICICDSNVSYRLADSSTNAVLFFHSSLAIC